MTTSAKNHFRIYLSTAEDAEDAEAFSGTSLTFLHITISIFIFQYRSSPSRPSCPSRSSLSHERLEHPQRQGDEDDVEKAQHRNPEVGDGQVGRRLHERRGASYAGNNHWNRDRIQQDRQQHVTSACANQHRGKERP